MCEQLGQAEHIRYLPERVEVGVGTLYEHILERVRTKEAELGAEERPLVDPRPSRSTDSVRSPIRIR